MYLVQHWDNTIDYQMIDDVRIHGIVGCFVDTGLHSNHNNHTLLLKEIELAADNKLLGKSSVASDLTVDIVHYLLGWHSGRLDIYISSLLNSGVELLQRISDQCLECYSFASTDHNSEKVVACVLRTFEGLLVAARYLPLQCWKLEVHTLALA